jgi:hypothetical protein
MIVHSQKATHHLEESKGNQPAIDDDIPNTSSENERRTDYLEKPREKSSFEQIIMNTEDGHISSSAGCRSSATLSIKPLTKRDVMLWDFQRKEGIYTLQIGQRILNLRMNLWYLIVISKSCVFLYSLESYEII